MCSFFLVFSGSYPRSNLNSDIQSETTRKSSLLNGKLPYYKEAIRLGVPDASILAGRAPAVRSRSRVRPRGRVIIVVGLGVTSLQSLLRP